MKNIKLLIAAAAVVGIVSGCGSQPKTNTDINTNNYFELTKFTMNMETLKLSGNEYFTVINPMIEASDNKVFIEQLPFEIMQIKKSTENENRNSVLLNTVYKKGDKDFSDKYGPFVFSCLVCCWLNNEEVSALDTSKIYAIENFKFFKQDTSLQKIVNGNVINLGLIICDFNTKIKLYDK